MNQLVYSIEEVFQITGRGIVAVLSTKTHVTGGKALEVSITRPDGSNFSCQAFKEILLRRSLPPLENEAFLLKDVVKSDVPVGSTLCFA